MDNLLIDKMACQDSRSAKEKYECGWDRCEEGIQFSHERLVEMMRLDQGDACINPIAWMGKPQRGTGCQVRCGQDYSPALY